MNEEKFFKIIQSNKNEVNDIFNCIDSFYWEKKEKKIDGRTGEPRFDNEGNIIYRTLYPCNGRLRNIQERIHKRILGPIKYPSYVQGGIKGRSYATNARMHLGKKYKMHTDIRKFFPSISNEMVFQVLIKQGFHPSIAHYITKLTTYKGHVPQGTKTATSLANLVFYHLADQQINDLCNKHEITYTRFVDDIFCSSQKDFKSITTDILAYITEAGFRRNHEKTRYGTTRMIITGVLTGNNVLNVPDDWEQKVNDPTRSEKSRQGLIHYRNYVKKISKRKPSKSMFKN